MKAGWKAGLYWLGSTLCVTGLAIGIHGWAGGGEPGRDFAAALALLLFNQGMFALADVSRGWNLDSLGLFPGLLWIGGKLFVNLFTLFLLIVLQAVVIRVFVVTFFAAYPLVMISGIVRLHFSNPNLAKSLLATTSLNSSPE